MSEPGHEDRAPAAEEQISRLISIMARLRSEGGCPWDREQTLKTLKPFLLEEAYEVLDAIDDHDYASLEEELGDVLLQVVFQSRICEETGAFSFADVAKNISEKLIRRHPHVFSDVKVDGSREVLKNWEAIKKDEKKTRKSALDGVPRQMPALMKADKIQSKAARVGFDWDQVHDVMAKVEEELQEVQEALLEGDQAHVREELGDLLFAAVNLGRFLGHDAEETLNESIDKFVSRFQCVEQELRDRGREMSDCSLEEMDAVWNEIKKRANN